MKKTTKHHSVTKNNINDKNIINGTVHYKTDKHKHQTKTTKQQNNKTTKQQNDKSQTWNGKEAHQGGTEKLVSKRQMLSCSTFLRMKRQS